MRKEKQDCLDIKLGTVSAVPRNRLFSVSRIKKFQGLVGPTYYRAISSRGIY